MSIHEHPSLEPMVGDVDDHRPSSRWALVTDPDVHGLAAVIEDIAPGDRIPVHTHPEEEAIFIVQGHARVRLGGEERDVQAGAVLLVPANTPHGTRNTSSDILRVHAVFPGTVIGIEYLERNPAPATEAEPPQPPFRVDLRGGW